MTIRVIQWATGAMGKTCLRAVIDHADLELVGLYVHSAEKAGLDAGEIARRAKTGVIASDSLEDILALDADVVLHCPLLKFPYDAYDDDVCRLLASGKNLISINNYFSADALPEHISSRLYESCILGNSTLAGTGLNPGFVAERVGVMASAICLELDSVKTREVFDCLEMPNKDYVFGVMGMGSNPDTWDPVNGTFANLFRQMYSQSVHRLAKSLELELDQIESDNQITLAPTDIHARSGVIRKGTVAATNWQHHGVIDGRRVITHSVNWIMGKDLPGYENARHWEVAVRGKPGIDIQMDLVEAENDRAKTKAEQYAVAALVVRAIPLVLEASAGFYEFPQPPAWRARLN